MAVRSRQRAIGVTLLLGFLGLLVLLWWNQQPSIMPSDVQIEAILRPPGQAENPVPGGDRLWTMEITLNKTTRLPIHNGLAGWSHQVTPFIQGMHGGEWDFMQGLSQGTTGSPVGGDGYSFGMDGIHIPLIEQALTSVGMSVTPDRADGFTYLAEEFPAVVRYYFRGGIPGAVCGGGRAF